MLFRSASVVFIVIAAIVLYLLLGTTNDPSKSEKMEWPPVRSNCPDYWTDWTGNGSMCVNMHNSGKCNVSTTPYVYGENFVPHLNRNIEGNTIGYFTNKSKSQCQRQCIDTKNGKCAAYVHSPATSECWTKTAAAVPASMTTATETNLYFRQPQKDRVVNFTTYPFGGAYDVCAKNTWANNCGVTWDGITNAPSVSQACTGA